MIILKELRRILSRFEIDHQTFLENAKTQNLIPAAVIVLISKETNNILYIKRSNASTSHQGEIGFPGGKYDNMDKNLLETMKRELFEEIRIPSTLIEILGSLKPMKTVTGFQILPYVGGFSEFTPFFTTSDEVEKTLLVPLDVLQQQKGSNYRYYENRKVYFFHYDQIVIWGATAAITNEFLLQLENLPHKNDFRKQNLKQ